MLVAAIDSMLAAIRRAFKVTLSLFGVKWQNGQNTLAAHDELPGAIDFHMLGGIIELQALTVSDVMVHRTRMTLIDGSDHPAAIIAKVLKSGHTRIPVWKDVPDNIIGILHAKNLFAALQEHGGDASKIGIEDILSPAWFVPDTRALPDQLNAFLRRRTHFAIVVDEYGELQGLITLEDIIEEIVGDIKDEHDAAASGTRRKSDGSFIVDAGVPVRDLNRAFNWRLPDEEATTLAGLVIHEARMIPEAGQTFNFHGFQFEVLKKRKHQLTSIKVTPLKRVGDEPASG
jgi:Mg2+/Co2+ transporter CorB